MYEGLDKTSASDHRNLLGILSMCWKDHQFAVWKDQSFPCAGNYYLKRWCNHESNGNIGIAAYGSVDSGKQLRLTGIVVG